MIESAIDAFGGVDVLVCNEEILRDRMLVNMSESEWDSVIPPPPLIPILMGSRPPL